jgi:LEA14-like dessication related protein
MTIRLFALSVPLLLSACSDSGYLPTVSFERLDLQHISWQDVDADFVFSVKNPNPLTIDLARFDYDLSFSGVHWVSGDNPDGLVLEASGTSEWALPTHIVFQELYDLVQATKGEDTIPFEIAGTFGFDTSIGAIDLPYRADGGFPALRTPEVGYQALRVTDIGVTTADLALDLGVTNEHGSNLWFKDFDYDVDLSSFDIGSGQVADLGEALPDKTTTLTLPFTVDLLESGMAVLDILTGNDQADLDLTASTDVDTPFGVVPLSIDEHGNVTIE